MAKLNESIIRSMVWDLTELMKVCGEISTFAVEFDFMSWRYPLQTCHTVDIIEILNQQSGNNSEDYIQLLELIYDRMLFALNLMITFFDNIPAMRNKFALPKNVHRPQNLTLGAVINMMWFRIKTLQDLLIHVNTVNMPPNVMKITNDSLQREVEKSILGTMNNLVCKSSQTDTHSLVICASCNEAQDLMKSLIVDIESSNSDCSASITAIRQRMKDKLFDMSHLSAMRSWVMALRSDVCKLIREKQESMSINNSLKSEINERELCYKKKLSNSQNTITDLKSKNTELQGLLTFEGNRYKINLVRMEELEDKLVKQSNVEEWLRDNLNRLEMAISDCSRQKECLDREIIEVHHKLERAEDELEIWKKERDDWKLKFDQEKNIRLLADSQRREATVQLGDLMTSCDKQVAKLKDTHTQECNVSLAEITKVKKVNSEQKNLIKTLQVEKEQLASALRSTNDRCNNMESQMSQLSEELNACLKRETKLLQQQAAPQPAKQFRVRGNPIEDMEAQVHANRAQLKLLEEDNCRLQKTICKLKQLNGKS